MPRFLLGNMFVVSLISTSLCSAYRKPDNFRWNQTQSIGPTLVVDGCSGHDACKLLAKWSAGSNITPHERACPLGNESRPFEPFAACLNDTTDIGVGIPHP